MMPRILLSALAAFLLLGGSARAAQKDAEAFFENNVRPVLVAHCAKCHGADKQSGGLRVDSRAAILARRRQRPGNRRRQA